MAGGAQPKRVTCPTCRAPEGMPCRDPVTFKAAGTHGTRQAVANIWYERVSPDGLTPKRRDAMVEVLKDLHPGKGEVGKYMQKITTAQDPEAEFKRLTV